MFSFHATKVFHTIEGGCLTYHDASLTENLNAWKKFGMSDGVQATILGTNAKLTEFAAAMGLCNLRHLDEQIALRRKAMERYRERLSGKAGLVLCGEQPGVSHNYAYMPLRVLPDQFGMDRDKLVEHLAEKNIFSRKYFSPLTSEFPVYQGLCPIQETPIASEVAAQILCLPLYADLTVEDVDRICDAILG